ncbi:MAG: hypothetical protein WBP85_03610 [Terracidiphilus sp.]
MAVIEGQEYIVGDAESLQDVRDYLAQSAKTLLAEPQFLDVLPGFVLGNERVPIIEKRLTSAVMRQTSLSSRRPSGNAALRKNCSVFGLSITPRDGYSQIPNPTVPFNMPRSASTPDFASELDFGEAQVRNHYTLRCDSRLADNPWRDYRRAS